MYLCRLTIVSSCALKDCILIYESVVVCSFSWRYNLFGCIFHSPVAGSSRLVFRGFLITTKDSPGRVINPSQRPLPDNTHHSQQTNIHAPGGIRNHDLSRRATEDLRLRPHSHWDRLLIYKY